MAELHASLPTASSARRKRPSFGRTRHGDRLHRSARLGHSLALLPGAHRRLTMHLSPRMVTVVLSATFVLPMAAAAQSIAPVPAPVTFAPTPVAAPQPLTVVEDSGSPFRTAIGFEALLSNTTGSSNTAAG